MPCPGPEEQPTAHGCVRCRLLFFGNGGSTTGRAVAWSIAPYNIVRLLSAERQVATLEWEPPVDGAVPAGGSSHGTGTSDQRSNATQAPPYTSTPTERQNQELQGRVRAFGLRLAQDHHPKRVLQMDC